MNDDKVIPLSKPAETVQDVLTDLLRTGAKQLLAEALEMEIQEQLANYRTLKTEEGRQAVVRNGYLPERTIQTGIGSVEVQVPKIRDRSGQGIKFSSQLVPPYLKRAQAVEEFLPWLYLKGVSTGDFQDALKSLLGANSKGLSANTISRLKQQWEQDYERWRQRDLSGKRYVYVWVDGVYSNVRLDDRLCLLVIVGADEQGRKELLALADGYRESEASWHEVLQELTDRGLPKPPKLAIGDGALGFWKALRKHWPETAGQRCWVHKTLNVLNKLPKSMQPKVKADLHEIWQAESREQAEKAFDRCCSKYQVKYPRAMDCLKKDREFMLAFYDFPAEHWVHIRTTNPIESVFATVRLRTHKTKNCGSRATTLAMAFKLMENAQRRWIRLKSHARLAEVIQGVQFKDGIEVDSHDEQQGEAA